MIKANKSVAHVVALALTISAGTATMTVQPKPAKATALMALLPMLIDVAKWGYDHRNDFGISSAEAATTSGFGGTARTAQMSYRTPQTPSYRYYQTADGMRLNCDVANSQYDAQSRTSYYCTTQNNTQEWFAEPSGQPQQAQQMVAQQELVCRFDLAASNGAQTVYPCEDQRTGQRGWYAGA